MLTVNLLFKSEPKHEEFTVIKSMVYTFGAMLFLRRWSVAPTYNSGRVVFIVILMAGTIIHSWWKGTLLSALAVSSINVSKSK